MQMPIFKLRSDVHVRPQMFGDQLRYVVEDPSASKFYRIGRREYLIASAMNGSRDLEAAINFAKISAPELGWNEQHIDKAVRWLVSSGLLIKAGDKNASIASRKLSQPRSLDPFFFRIPFVPGSVIESVSKRLTWLFSPLATAISAIVVAVAIWLLLSDFQRFSGFSSQLFVPDRTLYWLVAWLLLKTVHELGHSIACIRMGGTIRSAGIGVMFMMPVPFVDLTDSWRLKSRSARILCSISGILVEMVVASMAVIVCYVSDNQAIQFTAAAIATLGTISTLAFNANPLSRFDGYFVVSDLFNRPNLWTDGQASFSQLCRRPIATLADRSKRLMSIYGGLCLLYRTLIVIGFAVATIVTWHGIGVAIVLLALYLWYLVPVLRARAAARLQPKAEATRGRDVRKISFVAAAAFAVGLLCLLPSPFQPASPGYISYVEPVSVRNESPGFVAEIFAYDGEAVEKGQPLARLENANLMLKRDQCASELATSEGRCRMLRAQGRLAELQAEEANARSQREQLAGFDDEVDKLTICAIQTGRFHSRILRQQLGRFLTQGTVLGTIAQSDRFEVRGSIAQSDIVKMRANIGEQVRVSIEGHPAISGKLVIVLPRGSDELENPTLAALYGGPIPVRVVSQNDGKDKLETKSARFTARIQIPQAESIGLRSGQFCTIRLAYQSESIFSVVNRLRLSLWEWLLKDARDIDGHTI
jgi:putative peptide zinc metalloprotease protein